MPALPDQTNPPPSHAQKVLRREIQACEDPTCCCEPEPRWLLFQHQAESPDACSEWDGLDRSPADEL